MITRTLLCLITILLGLSCATQLPYTVEETCALNDLKFSNAVTTQVISVNRTASERVPLLKTDTETVAVCELPKTTEEKRHVQSLRAELAPKVQYNDSIEAKQLLTGLGYYLFVLPGVGLKLKYDADYDAALAASRTIESTTVLTRPTQATFPKEE